MIKDVVVKYGKENHFASIGCVHLGKENKHGVELFYSYVESTKPNGIILGGDTNDAPEFRASKNYPDTIATKRKLDAALHKDVTAYRTFITNLLEKSGGALIYDLEGNHEYRYHRFAEKYDYLNYPLSYEKRKAEWLPKNLRDYVIPVNFWGAGQKIRIGNAQFIHGRYYGKNHLQKHYEAFGVNTFLWHTHEFASKSIVTSLMKNAGEVTTLGCMEKLLPDWMESKPHDWKNCFQGWHFDKNGNFGYQNYVVHNDTVLLPTAWV